MKGLDDGRDRPFGNVVNDSLRIFPVTDQIFFTKHGQMLRQRGLAEGQSLVQLRHIHLALDQYAQDAKPLRVGDGFQQFGGGFRLGNHGIGGKEGMILIHQTILAKFHGIASQ